MSYYDDDDKPCVAITVVKTVYAMQEFFVGQWDDVFKETDKVKAEAEFRRRQFDTPRCVRLIERVERVMVQNNKRAYQHAVDEMYTK